MRIRILFQRRRLSVPLVCIAALLAGCTVGPDYEEPEIEIPDAWENAAAADIADTANVLADW